MDINKNARSTSLGRSRRQIKKVKTDESFTSDINEVSENNQSKVDKNMEISNNSNTNRILISNNSFDDEEQVEDNLSNDIKMEGTLIYRYSLDQIELNGNWSISSVLTKEHFSYLLENKKSVIPISINKNEINFAHYEPSWNAPQHMIQENESFNLNLCAANLFEALLVPKEEIFHKILEFLSGDYYGFFVYYSKTIEDRFTLNYVFDNLVKINGEGTNAWGEFSIIGYINFYTMKEQMINNNKIESDVINLGEIQLTRMYNKFNNNENSRVIKSYQHSRKKNADEENKSNNNINWSINNESDE